jgi:hypothetical protein
MIMPTPITNEIRTSLRELGVDAALVGVTDANGFLVDAETPVYGRLEHRDDVFAAETHDYVWLRPGAVVVLDGAVVILEAADVEGVTTAFRAPSGAAYEYVAFAEHDSLSGESYLAHYLTRLG